MALVFTSKSLAEVQDPGLGLNLWPSPCSLWSSSWPWPSVALDVKSLLISLAGKATRK